MFNKCTCPITTHRNYTCTVTFITKYKKYNTEASQFRISIAFRNDLDFHKVASRNPGF